MLLGEYVLDDIADGDLDADAVELEVEGDVPALGAASGTVDESDANFGVIADVKVTIDFSNLAAGQIGGS